MLYLFTFVMLISFLPVWAQKEKSKKVLPVMKEKPAVEAFDVVKVEGGTFTMGCLDTINQKCDICELPTRKVTVKDFYITRCEITQKQWASIMGTMPSNVKNCDDCPVTNISYNDALEYIHKVLVRTGKKFRLPTEAEWEYAARGGKLSKSYIYAGSNAPDSVAQTEKGALTKVRPIAKLKPNELGLYDLSGNAWEWCADWFGDYIPNATENPKGAPLGTKRVIRGGSAATSPESCRVSNRSNADPNRKANQIGFRMVIEKWP